MYYQRTPLWTVTFDGEEAPSTGGLRAAFNERNNVSMENFRPRQEEDDNLDDNYFENVELAPMGEQGNGEGIGSYANRVHSIHRNRLSNNQRDGLERCIEARTGRLNGRTSMWRRPTGKLKFGDIIHTGVSRIILLFFLIKTI